MEISKPAHIWQLSFDGDWPTSVAFLGSSRKLAAGSRDGRIFVWDLPESPPESQEKDTPPDAAPVRQLVGHENGVTHLIATDDGKTLISSSLDRTIRIWDVNAEATGKGDVILDKPARERLSNRKSAAEKAAILEAPGATVETIGSQHTLEGHKDWIKALGISADGRRLISGDDTCLTIVWNLQTKKQIASWHGYQRVWVTSAALSPDGKTAFVGEFAGRRSSFDVPAAQARLWDAQKGQMTLDLLKVWTPTVKDEDRVDSYGYGQAWGKLLSRGLVCARFSPDGTLLAVGQGGETDKGQIHLVNVESGKIERTVSGHQSGACDVRFSADGRLVLSSGRDTVIRVCQVADGKEIATLGKARGGQFKDWFYGIAISPDEQFVAAADIAGLVHVWQLNS
ncbi:MAG: hypothetical protein O2820_11990 [Planctomycetota bacterium]|nr:hypothetical protein [Planctomycetota bacterium]MDA1249931.1 hypothetical protein [Planctomycetota bacterium]